MSSEIFPEYYERFCCIADRCEDTCCAGWEIDIDDASYEAYCKVGGELGERLRACIKTYETDSDEPEGEEGAAAQVSGGDPDAYEQHGFILTADMRCPFLDDHNLCDLYRELGESALCEVCTNTPRNFLEYRAGVPEAPEQLCEISISASCPEAARLIYGSPEKIRFVRRAVSEEKDGSGTTNATESADAEELADEAELGAFLFRVRGEAIGILQDRERKLPERIRRFLAHSELVQEAINAWESDGDELPGVTSVEPGGTEPSDGIIEEAGVFLSKLEGATDVSGEPGDAGERYRHFLIRMGSYSGLASIGEKWADRIRLIYESFIGESDEGDPLDDSFPEEGSLGNNEFIEQYTKTTDNMIKSLTKENRLFEYEHLLVYYAFLLLNRSIDDYDYLGKAKLTVLSYLMNRDMDSAVFFRKGSLAKEDREENARIYAREVEHAEENLADLAEEILFERAYDVVPLSRTV